jgi:hypothetical protein
MSESFSDAEKKIIGETVGFYVQKLINDTVELIHQTEREADKRFSEAGIQFDHYSPANSDYLTAVLHENLFDRLHKGDPETARLILTMNGKRVGVCKDDAERLP